MKDITVDRLKIITCEDQGWAPQPQESFAMRALVFSAAPKLNIKLKSPVLLNLLNVAYGIRGHHITLKKHGYCDVKVQSNFGPVV